MMAKMLLDQLLPGVNMEDVQQKAIQIAQRMVETADRLERVERMLIELIQSLDAGQGATLLPILNEGNHDDRQHPTAPGNAIGDDSGSTPHHPV